MKKHKKRRGDEQNRKQKEGYRKEGMKKHKKKKRG